MLIQYSTNCISKWLSEFGCLTKLSTELFNGMKVYSHLIYTSVRDKPFVKCKFHRPCIVTQESARSYDMGGCMMKAFPC